LIATTKICGATLGQLARVILGVGWRLALGLAHRTAQCHLAVQHHAVVTMAHGIVIAFTICPCYHVGGCGIPEIATTHNNPTGQ
jgi:hypothetical protein